MSKPPVTWCTVLEDEYRALHGDAPLDAAAPTDPDARLRALHQRIHERGPSALCLSGGGIRSATFALGVLQGLAHVGVLGTIDYLSTVSGGGYTGGWFTAWLQREGPAGRDDVLRDHGSRARARSSRTVARGRARRRSNASGARAATSRRAAASCRPTSGRLVTTMARNLLLNWLVILPLLAAALTDSAALLRRLVHAVERGHARADRGGRPCAVMAARLVVSDRAALRRVAIVPTWSLNFVGLGGSWSQGRFPVLVPAASGRRRRRDDVLLVGLSVPGSSPVGLARSGHRLVEPLAVRLDRGRRSIAARIRGRAGPDDGSAGLRCRVGRQDGPRGDRGAAHPRRRRSWWFAQFRVRIRRRASTCASSTRCSPCPIVLGLALLADGGVHRLREQRAGRCGARVVEPLRRLARHRGGAWLAAGVPGVLSWPTWWSSASRALSRCCDGSRTATAAVAALVPLLSSLAGMAARSGETLQEAVRRCARSQKRRAAGRDRSRCCCRSRGRISARSSRLEYHMLDGRRAADPR